MNNEDKYDIASASAQAVVPRSDGSFDVLRPGATGNQARIDRIEPTGKHRQGLPIVASAGYARGLAELVVDDNETLHALFVVDGDLVWLEETAGGWKEQRRLKGLLASTINSTRENARLRAALGPTHLHVLAYDGASSYYHCIPR